MISNVVKFNRDDNEQETRDPVVDFLYAMMEIVPLITIENIAARALSGNIPITSSYAYNYAKQLAQKISPSS